MDILPLKAGRDLPIFMLDVTRNELLFFLS